jgi:hypothetical protein
VARKPFCGKCPIYAQCEFPEKKKFAAETAEEMKLPQPKAKKKRSILPR